MTESTVCLADLASVIRSKNAGPFVLTLDVFFEDREAFWKVREAGVITKASLAELHDVGEDQILEVTFFESHRGRQSLLRDRWADGSATLLLTPEDSTKVPFMGIP